MLDNNFAQLFDLNEDMLKSEINQIKITFESAYDTFGRIIIY